MNLINIKPLSINEAFQGRRFKAPAYKKYESDLLKILPNLQVPKDKELVVIYEFGFSNSSSDIDNPVKSFTDILQKKYGFNDSKIMAMHLRKIKVKKGEEFIRFKIEPATNGEF